MLQTYSVGKMRWRGSSDQKKYRRAKPGQVLFGAGTKEGLTLMLHTYVEEKRARVRQMWLRTGSDRSRRT